MFKVQCRRPVVGEILGHLAGSASSPLADVTVHGRVKRISTDDMMNMSRRKGAWLASGIKALEGQRRTWKAKPSLNRGDESESCSERLHLGAICDLDTKLSE